MKVTGIYEGKRFTTHYKPDGEVVCTLHYVPPQGRKFDESGAWVDATKYNDLITPLEDLAKQIYQVRSCHKKDELEWRLCSAYHAVRQAIKHIEIYKGT